MLKRLWYINLLPNFALCVHFLSKYENVCLLRLGWPVAVQSWPPPSSASWTSLILQRMTCLKRFGFGIFRRNRPLELLCSSVRTHDLRVACEYRFSDRSTSWIGIFKITDRLWMKSEYWFLSMFLVHAWVHSWSGSWRAKYQRWPPGQGCPGIEGKERLPLPLEEAIPKMEFNRSKSLNY